MCRFRPWRACNQPVHSIHHVDHLSATGMHQCVTSCSKDKTIYSPFIGWPSENTWFIYGNKNKRGRVWVAGSSDGRMAILEEQEMNKVNWVSWSAYHADIQQTVIQPAAINALLSLFLVSVHSAAMNAGQIPVLAAECRFYTLQQEQVGLHCRPTSLCLSKRDPVNVARQSWRGLLCDHVR